MRILNLLLGMLLFFKTISFVSAEVLTEEQVVRKVQCKNAISLEKKDLDECISGKYELSRYIECGKAKVNNQYLQGCLKGDFLTEKYSECIEALDDSTHYYNYGSTNKAASNPLFSSCLTSTVSFDHKKLCGKFNGQFFRYEKEKANCFDSSVQFTALKSCYKKLDDYKQDSSNYYDTKFFSLAKNRNIYNQWKGFEEYSKFIKDCYTIDQNIFKACFDYFDDGERGDLNRVDNCFKYQATADDIKKCDTILSKPQNKNDVIDCLYEFYAAKVARESAGKVDEVLNASQSETMKPADKNLNGDKRNKKKGVAVKNSDHNKVHGSAGKNH